MNGEYDDVYISYCRVYNIFNECKDLIFGVLKMILLNLGKCQGCDEDYCEYSVCFGVLVMSLVKGEVEWFLFYLDGVVSIKIDSCILVYSDCVCLMVSVVMFCYNLFNYCVWFILLVVNGQMQ